MKITENHTTLKLEKIFSTEELFPKEWENEIPEGSDGNIRIFNPTIIKRQHGYSMCYRVVLDRPKKPVLLRANKKHKKISLYYQKPAKIQNVIWISLAWSKPMKNETVRWLATCKLDNNLSIIPGSVTNLSSLIRFAIIDDNAKILGYNESEIAEICTTGQQALDPINRVLSGIEKNDRTFTWHADPRYFELNEKLFLSWNDGGNKPSNHQFMMEIDSDGIKPAGAAKEITADDKRTIEKNWMFFESKNDIYCVYSVSPHVILSVDMSDKHYVKCSSPTVNNWDNKYSDYFGVLRGGAQPILLKNGNFLSIIHSSYKMPEGRIYESAAYQFESSPPFGIKKSPASPLKLPNPIGKQMLYEKLNNDISEVIYPCGAILEDDYLIISYGINDENCAISRIIVSDALLTMEEAESHLISSTTDNNPTFTPEKLEFGRIKASVPLFWWDAHGKKFDGPFGNRKFITGNFGDIASRKITETISGHLMREPKNNERKFVSIGSVLHTVNNGDIIWGTGLKGTVRQLKPGVKDLDVYAARGPLTLNFLRESKIDISKVTELFDPGCLVSHLFKEEIATRGSKSNDIYGKIRVIPHYRDDLLFRRAYPEFHKNFVSVDTDTLGMVKALCGAEAVFSSSLHGIIFAESIGIPSYWIASPGGEDGFKFYDYYYGTGRYQVKCFKTLRDAMKCEPMPLPKFKMDAYLATFPHNALESLAINGISTNDSIEFGKAHEDTINSILERSQNGMFGPQVFWQTAEKCEYRACINGEPEETFTLTLNMRPFATGGKNKDRAISVAFHDGRTMRVCWKNTENHDIPISIQFTLKDKAMDIGFVITSETLSVPFRINPNAKLVKLAVGITHISTKSTWKAL